MSYNKQSKKPTSDRELVIREAISATRKNIISTELELDFLKRYMGTLPEPTSEEEKKMFVTFANQEMIMIQSIELYGQKLKFYKEKREELEYKKTMKELSKYPKTIKESSLYVDPRNRTVDLEKK